MPGLGNFTVRLAPLEAAPLAGSTADAADDATQEPSATQSPLNSRRFSNRIFTPYTTQSTAPIVVGRDGGSAVIVPGGHTKVLTGAEQAGRRRQISGPGEPGGVAPDSMRLRPTPCQKLQRIGYECAVSAQKPRGRVGCLADPGLEITFSEYPRSTYMKFALMSYGT